MTTPLERLRAVTAGLPVYDPATVCYRAESLPRNVYRLPQRFYDDHLDRDLPGGTIVRRTKKHYFVEMDEPTKTELVDDARYYAEELKHDPEYCGLVASARATVQALT